jgi:hypothetical protein
MDDIEFLFTGLTQDDIDSIQNLSVNYKVSFEALNDIFTAKKYNWESENSD